MNIYPLPILVVIPSLMQCYSSDNPCTIFLPIINPVINSIINFIMNPIINSMTGGRSCFGCQKIRSDSRIEEFRETETGDSIPPSIHPFNTLTNLLIKTPITHAL